MGLKVLQRSLLLKASFPREQFWNSGSTFSKKYIYIPKSLTTVYLVFQAFEISGCQTANIQLRAEEPPIPFSLLFSSITLTGCLARAERKLVNLISGGGEGGQGKRDGCKYNTSLAAYTGEEKQTELYIPVAPRSSKESQLSPFCGFECFENRVEYSAIILEFLATKYPIK